MEDERILERERYQMEQIRELEFEELQIEEVQGLHDSSDDDEANGRGYGGASASGEFTFNTSLASLHTYLGEVEETHHRLTFLDGGAVLNLPLFYLEGVVLFPEATLPLRVIQPNFIAVVERALRQVDAPYIIGVVRVSRDSDNGRIRFATIGTTAEIRQYRRLEDGSLNVVTRGQQRFRLRRCWIDVEGAPCGEIQIIQEDLPLRTPRDALGQLAPLRNLRAGGLMQTPSSNASQSKQYGYSDEDDSDAISEESFESELSLTERRLHQSAIVTSYGYDMIDESTSSDEEKFVCESELQLGRSHLNNSTGSLNPYDDKRSENAALGIREKFISGRRSHKVVGWKRDSISGLHEVPRAFWPFWVYRMYDAYCLAQRVADMWKQIVGAPSMDGFVNKPALLSFYIGSKIPVSESTRQELLEIDGISYRLRREIELLESFDRVRCKKCQTVIGRRSDMLVMSSEGPLGAYVNPGGYVHEVMTLHEANGLALIGNAIKEYSWFPGYAWTIAECAACESQMGWLFTATNKKLKPKSFWGIRSSQVADDMR
uniref:Protein cereblon n=1 Tax=Davidia involucrata TaxID=16924 RepID=A0A5B7BA39_DAVIN